MALLGQLNCRKQNNKNYSSVNLTIRMKKSFTSIIILFTLINFSLKAQKEVFLLDECYNFHHELSNFDNNFMWNLIVASDFVQHGNDAHFNFYEIDEYNLTPNSKGVLATWKKYYLGIEKCNELITHLNQMEYDANIMAQARFIRAYNYFHLAQLFGSVPIITEDCNSQLINVQKVSRGDVFNFVIEELEEVVSVLPEKSELLIKEKHQATKGAANSIIAMAHIYMNDWGNASVALEAVINSGQYALMNNFEDLWSIQNEHNIESIYEFEYSKSEGYNWGEANWTGKSKDHRMIQLFGPTSGEVEITDPDYLYGWGVGIVTESLVDLYDLNGDENRKNATVLDLSTIGNLETRDPNSTGFKGKKYITKAVHTSSENGDSPELNYGQNIIKIRYAEILLLYAEVQAHLGNEAIALDYLNRVRNRVGLSPVTFSGTELLDAIFDERTLELALEGKRFLDIVRWGKGLEVLGQYGYRDYKSVWPIPDEVIAYNPAIVQNTGYPNTDHHYDPRVIRNDIVPEPSYPWNKTTKPLPLIEKSDCYRYNSCMSDSILSFRKLYIYNNDNLLTEYILLFNRGENLEEYYKETYSYDENNRLILATELEKNSSTRWDTTRAIFTTYLSPNIIIDSIGLYEYRNNSYKEPTRFWVEESVWDDNNESRTVQIRNWLLNDVWTLHDYLHWYNYKYTYNQNNLITQEIWQTGDPESGWENSRSKDFTYSGLNLSKLERFDYPNLTKRLYSVTDYTYNRNNEIIYERTLNVKDGKQSLSKGNTYAYSSNNEKINTPLKYSILKQDLGHIKEREIIHRLNCNISPDRLSLEKITEQCSVDILFAPTATDECSGSLTGETSTSFPITVQGTNFVNWVFQGTNGNTLTQIQEVSVSDTQAPVPDVGILTDVKDEISISSINPPTATDNCSGKITGITNTSFPITETTKVVWTYDDGNGNVVTQEQNVIIDDITSPVPDNNLLPDIKSECSVENIAPPTATDSRAGVITGTTEVDFPIIDQGTTVVLWTFDDGKGNIATQNQKVIINDMSSPVPDIETLEEIVSECEQDMPVAPTATDNCSGIVIGTTTTKFPITEQGTTIISWLFDDGSGNVSIQEQKILIEDVSSPVPDQNNLDEIIGECIVESIPYPTATDNCSGSITGQTNVVLPITGRTTITWTFEDQNGNLYTQDQNVIIEDITMPDITCPETKTVTLTEDVTDYLVDGSELDPIYNDNCSISSVTNDFNEESSLANFTFYEGTETITWFVNDIAGNSNSCSFDLIITPSSVGFEEIEISESEIYPNPSNGKIEFGGIIKFPATISVFDLNGKVLYKKTIYSNKIDLSHLSNGTYLLIVDKKDSISKLIIKK